MTNEDIYKKIQEKQSFLCVGLDTDIRRIPEHLRGAEDPIFEFNKAIIDATAPYAIAYKPNIAFYESQGPKGWEALQKTIEYIPDEFFTIADAKRGDIGNTSERYAKSFFDDMGFDALTVSPYMGKDSVIPYLEYEDKKVIVLALTSNLGAQDFQLEGNPPLFERVIKIAQKWGTAEQIMFVIGATKAGFLSRIRTILENHFFLVPGVGAQGGDLESVVKEGINDQVGLIVNSSRSILYADSTKSFADAAASAAQKISNQMKDLLNTYHK